MTERPLPPQTQARQGWAALGWVALAAAVHGVGLLGIQAFRGPVPGPRPATTTLASAPFRGAVEQTRAEMAAAQRANKSRRQKATKPEVRTKLDGQVVALPPDPKGAKPPPDARFLAEHDSQTDHETSSRNKRADATQVAHERQTALAPREPSAEARRPPSGSVAGEGGQGAIPRRGAAVPASRTQPTKPEKTAQVPRRPQQVVSGPGRAAVPLLSSSSDPPGAPQAAAEQSPHLGGKDPRPLGAEVGPDAEVPSAGPRRPLSLEDLVPGIGVLSHVAGAPAPDLLDGVAEGEGTFLNAHAFKYAGFFHRLRNQVAGHWRPAEEVGRRDPTGQIYPSSLRATVHVVLAADGTLLEQTVLETSGWAGFDATCTEAFRTAAPFLHPPKGLLDGDGKLSFNFGFGLDLRAASVFGGDF